MKKALLLLIGAFALLFTSTAQAEVNGTFNVTENWTVIIDYKNFGPNGLTTKKTFTGTASGTVVVNNGQYDLIDKVTAAAGPIPWQQVAAHLKARTISQSGETFSITGNIVFGEGTKVTTSPPFIIFQGIAFLGFFGVPITVDQSELISSAVAPEFFHAMGPAGGISGGGDFPNQEVDITVSSLITMAAKPPEAVLPVAKITSPLNNAHVTTPHTEVKITATDNVGIASVAVTIENSAGSTPYNANLETGVWKINAILAPGSNKIRAKAKDVSGNFSAEAVSTIFYDLADQLTVNVGPGGTVVPNLNSSNLIIGRTYTIVAKPAAGFAFAGWTGSTNSPSATLKFVMQQDMVLNAAFNDVTAPTVTVTSPRPNARILSPDLNLIGTSKDNNAVARVRVQLNDGPIEDASGTTAWMHGPRTMIPGPNKIRVFAEDHAGKRSKTNTFTVTYVVTAPFNVSIQGGNGKISPNLNGQMLEVGKKYTITAVPSPGFAFVCWVLNGSVSNKAAMTFTMQLGTHVDLYLRDASNPKITIVSPKANASITNETVTVAGTATDNVGIRQILYRIDGTGDWIVATGTSNWTTGPLALALGKHTVQVYGKDFSNNSTPTNSVTFTLPTYAGIYIGSFSSPTDPTDKGYVGVIVRADRSALVIGGSSSFDDGDAFSFPLNIHPDGSFVRIDEDNETVAGKVSASGVSGTYPEGKFSMTRRPDTGAQAAHAGYYHGTYEIRNGSEVVEHGFIMALVSADGQVLFNTSSEGLEGEPAQGAGKGTLVGTKFTANAGGAPITGTIDPATHVITGTFRTEDGNGSLTIHREFGTAITGLAGVAPQQGGSGNFDVGGELLAPTGPEGIGITIENHLAGSPTPPIPLSATIIGTAASTAAEAPLIVITEVGDSFTIGFATQIGITYTVQVSEDLTNWTDLIAFTAQTEGYEVADPNGGAARFYRVIVR